VALLQLLPLQVHKMPPVALQNVLAAPRAAVNVTRAVGAYCNQAAGTQLLPYVLAIEFKALTLAEARSGAAYETAVQAIKLL
jgi:hypothetical protein